MCVYVHSYVCVFVYLSFRKAESCGQLSLPPDGDVSAVVELLLQLQPLVVCVHHTVLVLGPRLPAWNTNSHNLVKVRSK